MQLATLYEFRPASYRIMACSYQPISDMHANITFYFKILKTNQIITNYFLEKNSLFNVSNSYLKMFHKEPTAESVHNILCRNPKND